MSNVDASGSVPDREILLRFLGKDSERPNPGLPGQALKLPHAELWVLVHGDLDRRLEIGPRIEVLVHLLLDSPVLPPHAVGQFLGVDLELSPNARQHLEPVGAARRRRRHGRR